MLALLKKKLITEKWHRFHWFILGITLLKLLVMGLFSSDYQNSMFMPFVENFISHWGTGQNPYDYIYANSASSLFPYPPLMLFIQSLGAIGSHFFNGFPLFIKNVLFKLPTLGADFLALYYLVQLYPEKRRYVGAFYFASPIIIYAAYMHGQLDLIPTAFLVAALNYLTIRTHKYRAFYFIFFLFCAMSTKLHILAVLPVLGIYIQKKYGLKKALFLIISPVFLTTLLILPYLNSNFIYGVLFNQEQAILTDVFFQFTDRRIFIPILAVLIIYLKMYGLDNINKDLLFSFCGLLFSAFLLFIPPMPAWYIWIVPFMTIFLINVPSGKYKNIMIFFLLNGMYLVYFLFSHKTPYVDLYFLGFDLSWIKFSNATINNFSFTFLSALLLYSTGLMYQLGIVSNSFYKRRNIPFTIGISGDSGSGKSELLQEIQTILGQENLLVIEGDGDHKWERGKEEWSRYTHLDPKANYLYRQARDIQSLRDGEAVKRVDYDHGTGKFTNSHRMSPKRYIVLCGLHSFYLPQMRDVLDLKIFMDTDETLRRYWKIQRDTMSRGYSKEKIAEQIKERIPDAQKYIVPQKEYADVVIQYFDRNLKDCFEEHHKEVLSLRVVTSAAINMEPLMQKLQEFGIHVEFDYSGDLNKQTVVFDGDTFQKAHLPFDWIANELIPQMDELTQRNLDCEDNLTGIVRLVLLLLISCKMKGEYK